jgi:hypothetical protein
VATEPLVRRRSCDRWSIWCDLTHARRLARVFEPTAPVDLRRLFDEPFRKRVGQGHHRKLLLVAENRMDRPNGLPYTGRRQGRRVDYIERVYNTIRRHSTNGCSARLSSKRRFD